MLIYIYDRDTKEYLREQEAQRNPKRPSEYLMPANSTIEQIPDIKERQVIVWGGEHWTVKDDFRGLYMVNEDMQPVIVQNIGALPFGYVLITSEQIGLLKEKGQNYFVIQDGELIKNPNYEKEEEEKEKKRIAMLNMTKYDFFKYVCKPYGITYAQLLQFVNANEELAAAWDLCERVYRGDELLLPAIQRVIPTITEKTLTEIFERVNDDN